MSWLELDITEEAVHGSEAWRESRKRYLGASECSAVLGLNPHDSPSTVWNAKVHGIEEPENYHMTRGKEVETEVLIELMARGHIGGPKVEVCQHAGMGFLRASYDFLQKDRCYVIEVKAPEVIYNEVPMMYWCQLQIQMYIARVNKGLFYAKDALGLTLEVWVDIDNEWLSENLPRLKDFWESFVVPKRPLIEDVEASIENQEFEDLLAELGELQPALKKAEKRVDEIKAKIRSHIRANETRIGRWLIHMEERRGAIDYGKIPSLADVNLESYRKPVIYAMKVKKI